MDENITRWRLILGQDANALGEVSLNEQQSTVPKEGRTNHNAK